MNPKINPTVTFHSANAPPPFSVATSGCDGKSLAPGDSCEWMARFKPTQTGEAVGKLTATSAASFAEGHPISLVGQLSAHLESTSAKLSAKILVEASHGDGATRRIALTIAVEVGRPLPSFRITSAALGPKGTCGPTRAHTPPAAQVSRLVVNSVDEEVSRTSPPRTVGS